MTDQKRMRRIDSGGMLRSPRKDKWGNLLVDSIVVKPGVYSYRQNDGSIRRELKHPDEIFAPAHMESVRHAAVTDEHLPNRAPVTPDNAHEAMKGHAIGVERTDADEMLVPLKITDSGLIATLERRVKKGVSLGLDCWFDATPGVWNGEEYHGVQRGMITNQISATGHPRIGGAGMRLDSLESDDAIMVDDPPQEEEHMTKMQLTIGDSTVEVETGAGSVIQARLAKLDSELESVREEARAAIKLKDETLAKLDTANDELEKKKGLTVDADDIPRLFKERSELIEGAKLLLDSKGLEAVDDASDMDVRRAACEAHGVKVGTADEGKNDDYVCARFDSLVELKRSDNGDKLDRAVAGVTPLHPSKTDGAVEPKQNDLATRLAAIDSRHKEAVGGMRQEA